MSSWEWGGHNGSADSRGSGESIRFHLGLKFFVSIHFFYWTVSVLSLFSQLAFRQFNNKSQGANLPCEFIMVTDWCKQKASGLQLPATKSSPTFPCRLFKLSWSSVNKKDRFVCAPFLDLVNRTFQASRMRARLQYETCTVGFICEECVFGVARILFRFPKVSWKWFNKTSARVHWPSNLNDAQYLHFPTLLNC